MHWPQGRRDSSGSGARRRRRAQAECREGHLRPIETRKKWAHSYKLLAESMLPRIRQLEDERDRGIRMGSKLPATCRATAATGPGPRSGPRPEIRMGANYRQLAEFLQQQVQALETDRDQKFEWAVSYRQSAEALQQTVEGLQRRLAELEADRDRKFAWAENYKASMENEKQRADELARCARGTANVKAGSLCCRGEPYPARSQVARNWRAPIGAGVSGTN